MAPKERFGKVAGARLGIERITACMLRNAEELVSFVRANYQRIEDNVRIVKVLANGSRASDRTVVFTISKNNDTKSCRGIVFLEFHQHIACCLDGIPSSGVFLRSSRLQLCLKVPADLGQFLGDLDLLFIAECYKTDVSIDKVVAHHASNKMSEYLLGFVQLGNSIPIFVGNPFTAQS